MRAKAKDRGIRVPEFIQVLNHDNLKQFMKRIPAPWVLKPRSQASAIGIKKIETAEQLWQTIETLGDQQSFNLYDDPEIVWRLNKRHHAGLIVRSDSWQRVNTLIGSYTERFRKDFHASMPVPDRPSD